MTPDERRALIERRKVEFRLEYPGEPDYAPWWGYCWRCGTDLVALYRDLWPRAWVTGCTRCHRSYCD